MLEILQFYVSSFWVWLGITYGIAVILGMFARIIISIIGHNPPPPTGNRAHDRH